MMISAVKYFTCFFYFCGLHKPRKYFHKTKFQIYGSLCARMYVTMVHKFLDKFLSLATESVQELLKCGVICRYT